MGHDLLGVNKIVESAKLPKGEENDWIFLFTENSSCKLVHMLL
jgi:hypothetical protein